MRQQLYRKTLFFIITLTTPLFAKETVELMIQDLSVIKNTLEIQYAPAEWKKTYCGWDLEDAFENAKNTLLNLENPNEKDYQQVVKQFLASTCDMHVSVYFYSTESASLPFHIAGAENRYFINWIGETDTLHIGDEITAINHIPISKLVEKGIEEDFGGHDTPTTRAIATHLITKREGVRGHQVPEGDVTVSLANEKELTFTWKQDKKPTPQTKPKSDHQLFDEEYLTTVLDEKHTLLGEKISFVPTLGKVIAKNSDKNFFHAYIYKNSDGKKIGYLRIPNFRLTDIDKKVKELQKLLFAMEKKTDALIIDLLHNPGGSAYYTYGILSMITSHPLTPPLRQFSLTQSNAFFAEKFLERLEKVDSEKKAKKLYGNTVCGYPVTLSFVQSERDQAQFIIDQWALGKRLTDFSYLGGIKEIMPHPRVRYTKPLLILVDQLSLSASDFFSAIVQDNKRALIFGAKTGGAGGGIATASHPNIFGISCYKYTSSFAKRQTNDPIENLGVTPDIFYEISADDLQNGYKGYAEAVNQAINSLFPKKFLA